MNVIFTELHGQHGARIGVATLDATASLNALTLPMIEALSAKLTAWATEPSIVCVVLRGNGEKAFCAGGDVLDLVTACRAQPGQVPDLARRFFADEYRLDHLIHRYPKPLLCWAHGYVMGGGMGLMQGAGVRIVTPSSRLAMPEISIGLYPDVGGSWFLARLPGKLGLFLGLTGAHINGRDALDLDLADRLLLDEQQDELLAGLQQLNWQEQSELQLN
ncbi:MAG: enoyl-CoA hydratase/isomerase family protein, partial [Pseudomonas sp.]|nr:enoyl-CoA hydratase/isomerase family protein [Pseudomonas sp.]